MQEIILYVVLTIVVVAMLYSVLGKNVGQGPDSAVDPEELVKQFNSLSDDRPAAPVQFSGPAAEGLAAIAGAEPSFTETDFLDKAKMAYGMILEAFADGDKEALEGLLNAEVKDAYFGAIDARIKKDLTQKTDLARLISAEIIGASRVGKIGSIDVAYKAELATALLDKDGEVVDGDLDILSRVSEVWSYERKLGSRSPAWILSAVNPHEVEGVSNDDGPDHSPDTV